jgi:hypothetical protein
MTQRMLLLLARGYCTPVATPRWRVPLERRSLHLTMMPGVLFASSRHWTIHHVTTAKQPVLHATQQWSDLAGCPSTYL